MSERPQISEAEADIMQVLWERHPLAADEVFGALADRKDWAEATVKTLLNRLLKKGAIAAEQEGRRYLYSPLLQREQWVTEESVGLVDRLFGGHVAPLVAHFGKHKKLSKQDLAALRQLIEDLDDAV